MTAMTRWQGSLDPTDMSGTATYTAAGMVVAVQLGSFTDAQSLDRLIVAAEKLAGDRARKACAQLLRGTANSLEGDA